MPRLTIDFGIDLGTTNSSIAVIEKSGPRIIRNNDNWQFTPSTVWVDKNGALRVGMSAKERAFSDPENGAAEFKLMMGKDYKKRMARLDRSFKPEELSAEVLKSLKDDVKRETGEDLSAAVITVPAAFDQPESEATRRAAQLAGITLSPLLQEPVAAALAYGFQHEHKNVFWLVYDIGGGTFDAAVIHVRDGIIQVVNHGGDNDLGGKLIDWAVVDQLFVPVLQKGFNLQEFRRGNKKWLGAFAKLKLHAEKAKIALSKDVSYEINGEFICVNDSGEPVQLDVAVTRGELERLLAPLLTKSVNICRKVLEEQHLGAGDISKVILVGGPTVTPYLRQVLPDTKYGLGIPIDFSMDPLTVVAQGAALFAGAQKLARPSAPPKLGEFSLNLEYKPVGNDTEPLVGGRVKGQDQQSLAGYVLRFTNSEARPPWDSGKLPLSSEGTFIANLWAEPGLQNIFQVELYDPSGSRRQISPSEFAYTVGLVITDPPLTHDIGIAMADNKVDVLFKKGTPLPAKVRTDHRTTTAIRKGDPSSEITIPFVEGSNSIHADLNRKIGHITIEALKVVRDVPIGADVEIRIEIDNSRLLKGTVYIPVLDQEFPIRLEGIIKPQPSWQGLKDEFEKQKQRLRAARDFADDGAAATVKADLERIEQEDAIGEISRDLAAGDDPEATRTCEVRMLDLKATLQRIDDAVATPKLIVEAKQEIELTQEVVTTGTEEDRKAFGLLQPELEAAIHGDIETLQRKVDEMFRLRLRVITRSPEYWIGYRDYLLERQEQMQDQTQARLWFSHADRAINGGDIDSLKRACSQLWSLLPKEQQKRGYGGGTVRSRGITT
jgi:molecular chaperone DnaK